MHAALRRYRPHGVPSIVDKRRDYAAQSRLLAVVEHGTSRACPRRVNVTGIELLELRRREFPPQAGHHLPSWPSPRSEREAPSTQTQAVCFAALRVPGRRGKQGASGTRRHHFRCETFKIRTLEVIRTRAFRIRGARSSLKRLARSSGVLTTDRPA